MKTKCFKPAIVAVIILLFGTLISGGFFEALAQEGQQQKIKTLRVALYSAPKTLDPANFRDINTHNVVRMIGEGVMTDLPDSSLVNAVADVTEIDPLTYQIKVREGVTFHNGDPVTADDLIFSYKRLREKGGMEGKTSPRASLLPIDSVEKIDSRTIIARTAQFSSVLHRRWMHWEVMPKQYFEKVGIDGYLKNPVGCGPFKFVQGDLASEIVLERFAHYYGGPAEIPGNVNRIPAVDRLIIKPIPEATTRISALLAGEVDIIQDVPIDMIGLLKKNPNIELATIMSNSMTLMALNVNKPPFNDIRVRQAVGYAINYELLVEQMFSGQAKVLGGLPFLEAFRSSPAYGAFAHIQPYKYSPDKAKSLLKESGAEGVTFVLDTHAEHVEPAQAVAQMLNDVGFNASVRVWDYAVISQEVFKGERVAYFTAVGNGLLTPDWIIRYTSGKPASNYFNYSNPTFDGLMDKAGKMRPSPEQFKVYEDAFNLFMEELPILTLYAKNVIDAYRSNVKNYYAYMSRWSRLHRVDIE